MRHVSTLQSPESPSYLFNGPPPAEDIQELQKASTLTPSAAQRGSLGLSIVGTATVFVRLEDQARVHDLGWMARPSVLRDWEEVILGDIQPEDQLQYLEETGMLIVDCTQVQAQRTLLGGGMMAMSDDTLYGGGRAHTPGCPGGGDDDKLYQVSLTKLYAMQMPFDTLQLKALLLPDNKLAKRICHHQRACRVRKRFKPPLFHSKHHAHAHYILKHHLPPISWRARVGHSICRWVLHIFFQMHLSPDWDPLTKAP